MNWYLTKLIYRIICGDGNHTAQFDEQLRLVQANSIGEAFQKSKEIGKREEEIFFNAKEQLVQWQFVDVSELFVLKQLSDGAEVYSRIEEKENADAYIHVVQRKALAISEGRTHPLPNLA